MIAMGTNRYGLRGKDLADIRDRDQTCVYCHKAMAPSGSDGPRSDWATIEQLNHLPPWDNPRTVAICCWSCNSSRGNRILSEWFASEYNCSRGINESAVAKPVRDFLQDVDTRT